MSQNKAAVDKRREELKAERLDRSIKMYYFQKGAGEHYREIQYESGRVEGLISMIEWILYFIAGIFGLVAIGGIISVIAAIYILNELD